MLEKAIFPPGFDFTLTGGELEATFEVAGFAQKVECSVAVERNEAPHQDVVIVSDNIVPATWDRSGASVYLSLSARGSDKATVAAHLVGYVFLAGQETAISNMLTVDHHHVDRPHGWMKRDFSTNVHDEFLRWVEAWSEGANAAADLSRGISLAHERLGMLRELARTNADAACRLRLTLRYRGVLPAEVRALVEEPLDGEVTLAHIMEDNFKEWKHRRIVSATRSGQPPFHRYSSGHRAKIRTDRPVPVWGFVIDGYIMVISSSAARAAEPEESVGSIKRSQREQLVIVGGKPMAMDSSISVDEFGRHIAANDLQPIPEAAHPDSRKRSIAADPPSATAIRPRKTVLYIVTNFANEFPWHEPSERFQMMKDAETWYRTSFYGKIQTLDVTTIFLNVTRQNNMTHELVEAQARNLTSGLDWDSFDHWAVHMPRQMENGTGLGSIRARGIWLWYETTRTFVHEMGHNLGTALPDQHGCSRTNFLTFRTWSFEFILAGTISLAGRHRR
jgi:hypothetical protein